MLLITPDYAALREERARQTIDWLTGNFSLKPMRQPVVARLVLTPADKPHVEPAKRRQRRKRAD